MSNNRQYYLYNKGQQGFDYVPVDYMPGTRQILPDRFEEFYDSLGLVRTPFDFEILSNLYEVDTWHRRAILQKGFDSIGLGWDIVKNPIYDGQINDDDHDKLIQFFSTCSVDRPFEEMLQAVWIDYDVLGNGAIEVVRDGKGQPAELYHVPFKTLRIHKSQHIFAQVRGAVGTSYRQLQWFHDFNYDVAKDIDKTELPPEVGKWAYRGPQFDGELIPMKSWDPRSSYYGIPEAISAVAAIAANQAVTDYNLGRLANRGIPDYIMTLSGTDMDAEVQEQVKDFLNSTRSKSLADGPKILAFEVGQGTATFQKVTPENEDMNWLKYRMANRDEILAAHGMPKYRIGISEIGALGQNVAEEQSRIYAMGVVRHRRRRMEHVLNASLIQRGFGVMGWVLKFSELDVRNEKIESDVDRSRSGGVPIETPNEIRRKRGLGPDLLGGDRLVMRVGHGLVEVARAQGATVPEDDTLPSVQPGDTSSLEPGEEKLDPHASDRVNPLPAAAPDPQETDTVAQPNQTLTQTPDTVS